MKTIKNKHLLLLFAWVCLCLSSIDTAKAAGPEIVDRPAGDYIDYRWITIKTTDDKGKLLFPDPVKVKVRFVPKAMVWTPQGGSKDYNDPSNWSAWNGKDPSNHNGTTPQLSPQSETTPLNPALEFIPWSCTDVLIPDNAAINFPHLASETNRTTRNDNEVAGKFEPVCHDIWFEHGGEVVRTDLLTYRKANVELRLGTDRWYMTSAPLRYMFPGDYWRDDFCAWRDKLQVYTQLFVAGNPQQNARVNPTGDWTGAFNNPNIDMPAGFGFAAWLDDETYEGESFRDADVKHTFWFPKQNIDHYINSWYTCNQAVGPIALTRTGAVVANNLHHRFIYEQNNATVSKSVKGATEPTGTVTLTTEMPGGTGAGGVTGTNGWLIVGNPFMSHWNFNEFSAQNSSLIGNAYWVLDNGDDGAFRIYSKITTPADTLIAPMQSIVVSALPSVVFTTTSLKTNVTAMKQRPANKLKSASNEIIPDLLKVIVEKDGKENPTYVLFESGADNAFKPREDSYKLFVNSITDAVSVYTRSTDEIALDINVFGSRSEDIQLGVRTTTTGEVTLKFEGVETFLPEENLFIIDKLTGEYANLRENPVFSFEKITDELFMDNRLYLSFNDPTEMQSVRNATTIFTTGTLLRVTSTDNIKQVQVVDMQGRIIVNESNIDDRAYTCNLESNAMYIVKVLTDKESVVKKVITSNN